MKRFEIFRSKDPQVSTWLQKNGFRNRRSNGYEEKGENTAQNCKKETELQAKEVRFNTDEYVHSKVPSSVYKQTIPELRNNKTEAHAGRGCLKNMDNIPAVGSSHGLKRVVYQEKTEATLTASNCTKGHRIRSFSSPPNNELNTGHATATKDRPSLARSCPEYYITSIQENDVSESRELERSGFGRKAINVSTNNSQQLAKESTNQISPGHGKKLREQNAYWRREATGKLIMDVKTLRGENKYAKRRNDVDSFRKEFEDLHLVTTTDLNGNEISYNVRGRIYGSSSASSDEDLGFNFYEEDSLQSYTLEVLPKPMRNNFPSSMYSTKGTMLSWLGEVNRNNPQLWS
ncbi:hypothetical protein ACROYT_G017167 [Oculina patagonica]